MGSRCLSVTRSTSATHRDGLCCIFLMVRKTQSHNFIMYPSTSSFIFFFFTFCYTALRWVKDCTELLPSSYNTSRFDQPLQAVEWLRNFRTTNEQFLSKVTIIKQCAFMNMSHQMIFEWAAILQYKLKVLNIHSHIKACGVSQNLSHY